MAEMRAANRRSEIDYSKFSTSEIDCIVCAGMEMKDSILGFNKTHPGSFGKSTVDVVDEIFGTIVCMVYSDIVEYECVSNEIFSNPFTKTVKFRSAEFKHLLSKTIQKAKRLRNLGLEMDATKRIMHQALEDACEQISAQHEEILARFGIIDRSSSPIELRQDPK